MNNGLFGFFIGADVTIDTQEFDITTTNNNWVKPPNAQLCFVEGTGGGASGAGSSTTPANRAGGAAGVAYPIIILASNLNDTEEVVIGAGGVGTAANAHTTGGDTTFAGLTWAGGFGGSAAGRTPFSGGTPTSNWGTGGASSGTGSAVDGRHGGFGAGGGGRGAASPGNIGGKPRSFAFLAGAATPERGGGAPGGSDARPEYDIDGFGEGAGGGAGASAGKNGRRGSGGGGCGNTAVSTAGGKGGDGFLRVITYCW